MLKLGDLVGPLNTAIPQLALAFGSIVLLGNLLAKIRINPKKYAVLYSMILVSTIYACGFGYPLTNLATVANFRMNPNLPINYGPYIPPWVPKKEVLEAMTVGGTMVPWSEWTVPLAILWTGAVIYYFLWTSLYNIFRRRWIDIERLEFVYATVHTLTLINAEPFGEERTGLTSLVRRKRFLAALVIGFLFELQFALGIMFPWFPSVVSAWQKWPWVSWHPGTLDFGVAIGPAWFESLPGWTGIIFGHPVAFAVAFLVPVDILLSAGIFCWIQSSLIPMIMWFMGLVPKPAFPGGGSRYGYNAWYYGRPENPYLGAVLANFGVFIGLGLWYCILGGNWRYLVDTIRSAIKGPTKDEKEREAMSYRAAWLTFIISVVLFLVWANIAFGLRVDAGILWLIFWGFTQLTLVRMKAAGYIVRSAEDDWMGPPYYFRMVYPPFQNLPGTYEDLLKIYPDPNAVSWYGIKYLHGFKGFSLANTEVFATQTVVEAYKVGANLGIKPRDMFRSVTIASLIVMTISLPLGLWFYYTYGIKPEGLNYIWGRGNSMAASFNIPGWMWVGHPLEVGWEVAVTFVITVLICGALIWLKSHFIWFPINPIGFSMGVGHAFVCIGWGYTYLVTYFLKKLVLRIGGVKWMEEWVTPIAAGFIAGYSLGVLAWGLASIAVFFSA
ncbi:MAG: hypothetical protein DRJ47_10575 [Thermoprotei archaeon]|nr:MAG: hypothetical protein DRJ47_10575 [Thermoprotei archaeon]